MLKTYFFRRTNHGGAVNRGTGTPSNLFAIANWLQRRILWLSGDADEILKENQLETEQDEENERTINNVVTLSLIHI